MRGVALVLVGALLAAALPVATASHCETKLVVFGRPAPLPVPAPPHEPRAQGACGLTLGNTPADGHTLPPQTGQVLVRVTGDFGPAVPTLLARLDGLGFEDQSFALARTASPTGAWSYQMPEWVRLPNGTQVGELHVRVAYPGTTASVVYRSVA